MEAKYKKLLTQTDAILAGTGTRESRLAAICALLAAEMSGYDWVGFYLSDPNNPRELQLGPFTGAPTEHTRIPFGRGICGQVAESHRTMVVADVTAAENYLACSMDVRSEIVVPILVAGSFVGQLDIDSHETNRFTPADREFCEAICARLASGDLFDPEEPR